MIWVILTTENPHIMLLSNCKLQKLLYLIKFSIGHVHKNEMSASSMGVRFTFTVQYALTSA